ncbi:MAG: hypothetical protein SPL86_10710 [Succiniclasticum sp.]|uniref:hypothetical protein n=1 Tax=Succiniclasticum sp. TaxID=2775030 RepID=UPI002A913259|nr:hypothetical protein [Succiniclasticum sp.]MBR1495032.1 hypothetical protein [Acidaminococcaceae bacterium]MDY6291939.1 hypothetical protein [Succiniclasticum sp.]
MQKLGVSDKEAESGKLLVEHIYSLQLSKRPVVCDKVKVRKRFGDVSLRLETKGDDVYHGHRHDFQYYHRVVHVPWGRAPNGDYQR